MMISSVSHFIKINIKKRMVDSTKSILKGQEFNKSVRKDILINNIIWKRKATNHYNLHVKAYKYYSIMNLVHFDKLDFSLSC